MQNYKKVAETNKIHTCKKQLKWTKQIRKKATWVDKIYTKKQLR